MANNPNVKDNLVPFVKGDKRINRGGRPKSFDALRKLAQKIAGERPDEADVTRVTDMLIAMSKSKNSADRKLFLEYAYGKVKDELDANITNKIVFEIVRKEPENE